MPTVGTGAVEYIRLVTRTDVPLLVNSAAPADDGALKAATTMSSMGRDSRAARVKVAWGAPPGHVPRKHRYTAVTETGEVYDVLKTRTSEKKGAAADPGGSEATAGSVTVSAKRAGEKRTRRDHAADTGSLPMVIVRRPVDLFVYRFYGAGASREG
jgi:hypothetical protein